MTRDQANESGSSAEGPTVAAASEGAAVDPSGTDAGEPVTGAEPEGPASGETAAPEATAEPVTGEIRDEETGKDTLDDAGEQSTAGAASSARDGSLDFDDDRPIPAAGAEPVVPFPAASVRTAQTDLVRYVLRAPVALKVGFAAAGVLMVFLVIFPWFYLAGSGPSTYKAFVSDAEPLQAGPGGSASYPEITVLERNEQVSVLELQAEVGYAMVRDPLGRIGYVRLAALADAIRPNGVADDFTRCRRRPHEVDESSCLARAKKQFEFCEQACETSGADSNCVVTCAQRRADCVEGCKNKAVASALEKMPATAVEPEPTSEPQTSPEPAPEPEKEPPADDAKKNKKKKKKKRRKR